MAADTAIAAEVINKSSKDERGISGGDACIIFDSLIRLSYKLILARLGHEYFNFTLAYMQIRVKPTHLEPQHPKQARVCDDESESHG
ncbi:unnamed protein product [Sphenostylis stenocarpa]|uniref:Uncharacterized protein n=1 Tax=Sphenostylis stenocarpa TaxID=92480 RepID=A0AA86RYQ7_9FABA|nr:unnamed protein product [Sphenostylis stenocarpa]